jgi:hypothetical protein
MSLTGRSRSAKSVKMARRRGSATALNASELVAALAIDIRYILIQEYVKPENQ